MIDQGIRIRDCFEILCLGEKDLDFKKVLDQVRQDVEDQGTENLSSALDRHPVIFDKLYVEVIRGGITGGILDLSLHSILMYLEKRDAVGRKLSLTLVHLSTLILLIATTAATNALIVISHLRLAPTKMTLGTPSHFFSSWWALLIVIPIFFITVTYYFCRSSKGKKRLDRILLKNSVFGRYSRQMSVIRVCRPLSILLRYHVPITQSLVVAARSSGDPEIEKAINESRADDFSFGDVFKSPVFPPLVAHCVREGELYGLPDQSLAKLADFYEMDVYESLSRVSLRCQTASIYFGAFTLIQLSLILFDLL